ncbi:MAG: beta-lactamase family protein [Planctomycetaceae bacterium]|nr:beta-lactamase family protein [Planctomycetaceae bacterium]
MIVWRMCWEALGWSRIARNGGIAAIDAVGWRVIDKEPLETTVVFWAASITKRFVAVAIMRLVDEGKLPLDDLVEDHIPEFKGQKAKTGKGSSVTAKHPLTIRNLLNHLDGLPKTSTTKAAKTIKDRGLASAKSQLMWGPLKLKPNV